MGFFSKNPMLPCVVLLFLMCANASGARGSPAYCEAWRLNVEINNLRKWSAVPPNCVSHIAKYITNGQYWLDSQVAVGQSLVYLNNVSVVRFEMAAWVFDIDETALSNVPYLKYHKFGGEAYDALLTDKWILKMKAPALPYTLFLFNQLLGKGFNVFFITGRDEDKRNATITNLLNVGYWGWTGLIMRNESDKGKDAAVYKSEKREEIVKKGYRIWGNIGDQWSDLHGNFTGDRTFKLPNPMYYV